MLHGAMQGQVERRTGRWWVLLAALAGALAAAALFPAGAGAATSATGDIAATADGYVLTVQNTGDQPIICMRFFTPQGVTLATVSPPAQKESDNAFSASTNIAPGGSASFSFTTTAPYPPNAGGTLNVSSSCAVGSDVSSQVTGPPPGTTPPENQPCACSALTATLGSPTIRALHGRYFAIKLNWTLTCSPGTGASCWGVVKFTTVPGANDIKFLSPRSRTVSCIGGCNQATNGTTEVSWQFSKRVRPLANAPTSKRRKHKNPYPPVRVALDFSCLDSAGNQQKAGRKIMTIRFDRYGQVNKKKSDLAGVPAPQP